MLEAQYRGRGPFEEVWFGEVRISPESAFWFRYTLVDGAVRMAAQWAVLFAGGEAAARRDAGPLSDFQASGGSLAIKGGRLDAGGCAGKAGDIAWDLRFRPGDGVPLMPPLLAKLGLSKRVYVPARLDLVCDGSVQQGERRVTVDGARGVLGHIHGTHNSARDWAWGHCGGFEDAPDVVFEGISARLGRAERPLSGFLVRAGGELYRFSTLGSLARNRSSYDETEWRIEQAYARGARLSGRVTLAGPVAALAYEGADGRSTQCRNGGLSRFDLRLETAAGERALKGVGAFERCWKEQP